MTEEIKIYKPEEEEIAKMKKQAEQQAEYEQSVLTPGALAARTLIAEGFKNEFAQLSEKEIDSALEGLFSIQDSLQKSDKNKTPEEKFKSLLAEANGKFKERHQDVNWIKETYLKVNLALAAFENLSKAEQKKHIMDKQNLMDLMIWLTGNFNKYLKQEKNS